MILLDFNTEYKQSTAFKDQFKSEAQKWIN